MNAMAKVKSKRKMRWQVGIEAPPGWRYREGLRKTGRILAGEGTVSRARRVPGDLSCVRRPWTVFRICHGSELDQNRKFMGGEKGD